MAGSQWRLNIADRSELAAPARAATPIQRAGLSSELFSYVTAKGLLDLSHHLARLAEGLGADAPWRRRGEAAQSGRLSERLLRLLLRLLDLLRHDLNQLLKLRQLRGDDLQELLHVLELLLLANTATAAAAGARSAGSGGSVAPAGHTAAA